MYKLFCSEKKVMFRAGGSFKPTTVHRLLFVFVILKVTHAVAGSTGSCQVRQRRVVALNFSEAGFQTCLQ